MLSSILSAFLFFAPLTDTSINRVNDSLKMAYYDYMVDGPNPMNTFIPFKMSDSSGRTWHEMIIWAQIKERFYPIVGNNHKAFKQFIISILERQNPILQVENFGGLGFVINEEYAQLINNIPLDTFMSVYINEKGILREEYRYVTPEVMAYLFNHQVRFFHSPNLSVYIQQDFWKKYKESKLSSNN